MTCRNCHEDVIDDGHGELIHVIPRQPGDEYKYGCAPGTKSKDYPVAS